MATEDVTRYLNELGRADHDGETRSEHHEADGKLQGRGRVQVPPCERHPKDRVQRREQNDKYRIQGLKP